MASWNKILSKTLLTSHLLNGQIKSSWAYKAVNGLALVFLSLSYLTSPGGPSPVDSAANCLFAVYLLGYTLPLLWLATTCSLCLKCFAAPALCWFFSFPNQSRGWLPTLTSPPCSPKLVITSPCSHNSLGTLQSQMQVSEFCLFSCLSPSLAYLLLGGRNYLFFSPYTME